MDGLHVLELGCGEGRLTFQFADAAASVFAVDPDEERIAAARASLRATLAESVSFEVAGAADVDPPRREFDLALFSWSLDESSMRASCTPCATSTSSSSPGGTLVDIHPVTEEQVEAGGRHVGVIPEPEWVSVELPNSESALRRTIAEGLYELEVETEYDVLQHFDDAKELIVARSDLLEEQQELVAAIRAASTPLVTRMRVVFRRLRALRGAA